MPDTTSGIWILSGIRILAGFTCFGMVLALLVRMTRRPLPVLAWTIAVLLFPAAESRVPANREPKPDSRVRIEQQFVKIRFTPAERVRVASAPRRTVRTRAEPERAGLLLRATRTVVGDGRYRPEPFPRPVR